MFRNRRWSIAVPILISVALLFPDQAVQAFRGFRVDSPILNLIEICPGYITFAFGQADTIFGPEDATETIRELSEPTIVITATVAELVFDRQPAVYNTQFPANRILDANRAPIGEEGARIDVVRGIDPATGELIILEDSIYYAKGNWGDYTGVIDQVLKEDFNQTGHVTVEFSPPLEPGVELSLVFDVDKQDGTQIASVEYLSQDGLSMIVPTDCVSENLIQNSGFEAGKNDWGFFTNSQGHFTTVAPAPEGERAARVAITQRGSNVQLYQRNITLEPNTPYELRFNARSNSGHDLRVFMHQHDAPYAHYGLASARADLRPGYQTFTVPFTTPDLVGPITNARLRFWFAPFAHAGDMYQIDNVRLFKLSEIVAAGQAVDAAYVVGQVVFDDDGAGLLAGGPAPEDGSTTPTQQIFLPFVIK